MNKKLKDTFKELLKDKLPKTWEDFESLHPNKTWIIETLNNLLADKFFYKQFELRLLSAISRQTNSCKPETVSFEVFLTSVIEAEPEDKMERILDEVLEKPLFIPEPPKPKSPAKWLQLAKDLVEAQNHLEKFHNFYGTWNIEQVAVKLRDLCKENEDKIQEIVEELKKEENESN